MRIGIIGGGPAGYSAAIRLSEKGKKIYLFEKKKVGGVCLNIGCIPTKSLIYSADLYDKAETKPNWSKIQEKKALAVKRVLLGVKSLLKRGNIEIITEEAILKNDGSIESKGKKYNFDKTIIATGSKPINPPFNIAEGVWDSTDALGTPELPDSIVIIGAGYIGLEFAYIFSCLGSKVSVIEKENEVLPGEDTESSNSLRKSLIRKKIKFYLSSEVIETKKGKDKYEVLFKINHEEKKIESHKVLIAIGRKPNADNLPGEILEEGKRIKVNDFLETKMKNTFAIGDCTGSYLLAHSAFKDADIVTGNILGGKTSKKEFVIPRVVHTHPELASVGLSEEKAQSEGIDYMVSKVPYASNGRAIATGKTTGQTKFIHTKKGKIIGCTIVGEGASELIPLVCLAMDNKLNLKKFKETVFPHPTFSETIGEAAAHLK